VAEAIEADIEIHRRRILMQCMTEESDARRWFALQTRSRHEKVARNELVQRNIETFLPTILQVSQWKDRKKKIEFPLFSGYCFARFASDDRLPVLQSAGVVRIIGPNGRPEPIPEAEIDSLMILMNNRARFDVHPILQEGMPVEVIRGPLQGVRGRLVRYARSCRVVVSISLIQQAVAVEIDSSSIAPAPVENPRLDVPRQATGMAGVSYCL
jgi:transcription termination/antitermination protein NusG